MNTATGIRPGPAGQYPADPEELSVVGAVIEKSHFFRFEDDDVFECMEINDFGGVMLWTQKRVWFLRREAGMERLLFVYRHPPMK